MAGHIHACSEWNMQHNAVEVVLNASPAQDACHEEHHSEGTVEQRCVGMQMVGHNQQNDGEYAGGEPKSLPVYPILPLALLEHYVLHIAKILGNYHQCLQLLRTPLRQLS